MGARPCYVTNYRYAYNQKLTDDELADGIITLAESGATLCDVMGDLFCKHPEELTDDEEAIKKQMDLIDKNKFNFLWVVDWPLFEYSEEEGRYMACHHPFTSPKDEDVDKLLTDKANCYSKAYDIVINGYEAGGGSIRIHDENVQETMFKALELTDEDIENKFGFFVDALKYGCPPHGGFAIGVDRLTMLLLDLPSLKESMFLFRGPNRLTP